MTKADDLADALIEQAAHHRMVAHDCDCPPESTLNWQHYIDCGNAATELRRLSAEVERLRADAVRYRWLQEHTVATGLSRWMGHHEFLDAAIDAARAALAKESKP